MEDLPKLSNEDQIWIMEQVREKKLTVSEALEAVRKRGKDIRKGSMKKTASPSNTSQTSFFVDGKVVKDIPSEAISSPIIPIGVQYGVDEGAAGDFSQDPGERYLKQQEAVVKSGDEERLRIFQLVKSGRMTVDDAVKYADDRGLSSSAKREADAIASSTSAVTEQKSYNFAVYKIGKFRSTRRILQIDFRLKVISSILKGNVNKKYDFAQLLSFEADEGVHFKAFFDDNGELDMEADNPEEKYEICRLFGVITKLKSADVMMERNYTKQLPQLQHVIKEGELEKKGKGLTSWFRRWVRVRNGELSYYRLGEDTALNIVQLAEGLSAVTKVEENGFLIIGKAKQYVFRVPVDDRPRELVKEERNMWVETILRASHGGKVGNLPASIPLSVEQEVEPQGVEPSGDAEVSLEELRQELRDLRQQLEVINAPEGLFEKTDRLLDMTRNLDISPTLRSSSPVKDDLSNHIQSRVLSVAEDEKIKEEIDKRLKYRSRLSQEEGNPFYASTEIADIHARMGVDPTPLSKPAPAEDQMSGPPEDGVYSTPLIVQDDSYKIPASKSALDEPLHSGSGIHDEDAVKKQPESGVLDGDLVSNVEQLQPVPKTRTKHVRNTQKENDDGGGSLGENLMKEVPSIDQEIQEEKPASSRPSIPAPPPLISEAVPPPPPPSGGFFAKFVSTRKLKQSAKTKLRPFHWDRVPKPLYNKSLWKSAEDLSDKIDIAILEAEFAASSQVPPTPASAQPKEKSKTLLDTKRAQNLGIVLSGLKMSLDQLENRLNIIHEHEGALPLDQISMLKRLQPTSEDIDMYKAYKGSIDTLEKADQFMMQLCSIPNLALRLDALFTVMELPGQFLELQPSVTKMSDACDELMNSKSFHLILEYVLAVGNVLNVASGKGMTDGVQLTTLTKLADTRGRDKKFSLLTFIVEQLDKRNSELLQFYDEFASVKACAEVSLKGLNAEIEVMKKDLNKIQKNSKVLRKSRGSCTAYDNKFQQDVQEFVSEYDKKLKVLSDKLIEAQNKFKKTLEYFGENPDRNSEEFFGCLTEFIGGFSKEVKEYNKKKNPSNPNKALAAVFMQGTGPKENAIPSADLLNVVSKRKPSAQDRPTKEGYLEKLSGGKRRLQKWDTRFFELSATGHLHYFKKQYDKNLGSIYLKGCPIKIDEEDETMISIDCEERDFKIKAKSAQEAMDWFSLLCYYGNKG